MRVLAVDYGERRTGVAVSDELGITAQGLETIKVDDEAELPACIAGLACERGIGTIIIGLPLNMDGTESEKCRKVRNFGALVAEKTSLPVVFRDERLTSRQAECVMRELNMKPSRNKAAVDRISAMLLLEDYLKTRS